MPIANLPPPSHFEQTVPTRPSQIQLELIKTGYVEYEGSDAGLRPVFVGVQTHWEEWLVKQLHEGPFGDVKCVITTPAPPSPLCVAGEELSQMPTVAARAATLHALLDAGADITVIYDVAGLAQRSPAQQSAFLENLDRYPENLHSFEVDFSQLDPKLRETFIPGATYVCYGPDEEVLLFSVLAPQAHTPDDAFVWRVWAGSPALRPAICDRLAALKSLFMALGL